MVDSDDTVDESEDSVPSAVVSLVDRSFTSDVSDAIEDVWLDTVDDRPETVDDNDDTVDDSEDSVPSAVVSRVESLETSYCKPSTSRAMRLTLFDNEVNLDDNEDIDVV